MSSEPFSGKLLTKTKLILNQKEFIYKIKQLDSEIDTTVMQIIKLQLNGISDIILFIIKHGVFISTLCGPAS